MSIPKSAMKIAHYWYSDGNELVIFVTNRGYYIRDGKTGEWPFNPVYGAPHPYPGDGTDIDTAYETLGLYYGYEMAGTGWSGDC